MSGAGRAALIFDLDGTLVDSAPDIAAAVDSALTDEGAAPMGLAAVRRMIGGGVGVLIERVMAARGEPPDPARHAELRRRFLRHYEGAPAAMTRPYPGAPEALAHLAAEGHRLGLCTNKPEAIARSLLGALGLADLLEAVVGGDTLPVCKPDPAPLRAALAALGGGAALYVGDSEVDARAAAAAGMPLLLFTEGYRAAPVEALTHAGAFSRFADLPALVARLSP